MRFAYKARDGLGRPVRGTLEADSLAEVEQYLDREGHFPVAIEPVRPGADRIEWKNILGRLKPPGRADLIIFVQQMATLLEAGLPILRTLEIASEELRSPRLREAVEDVQERVRHGSSLADAFAAHPSCFSPLLVGMMKSGEASGQLHEILEHLAELLEFESSTEQRIRSATRYPKIVVGSLMAAFAVLMTWVVPRFIEMFSRQGVPLPLPTRILIQVNRTLLDHGLLFATGAVLGFFLFRRLLAQPKGRYWWDRMRLRWPVFGKLFLLISLGRFAKVLSMLARSGVPILKAFDMAAESAGNAFLADQISRVRAEVERGQGIAASMRAVGVFPSMLVQMTSVGEETGRLDSTLEKVSRYFDAESAFLIQNLSTYLEPMLLLLLGGMVGFLALSIFLPMWNVMALAKGAL
ncbi:MAG: type II secretion system F family protein [bacterium]